MSTSTATMDGVAIPRTGGPFHRLYYGETRFDFVRRRRWWFGISAVIIALGIVSLGVSGLNFDIEFVGGTSWQVAAPGVTVPEAQAVLAPIGYGSATITLLGRGANQQLSVQSKLASQHGSNQISRNQALKVADALAAFTHTTQNAVSIQQVGPTWGGEITHKAITALIVFLIVIAAYISIFFEWKMALAAIIAVAHDVVLTVGIYSIFAFLVTPDTVVAFLTILGYSLYDTIVVFDRIRANSQGLGATGKLTFTDVVNLSMNQTLARSINTSLVAILPILAVLVLGAQVLGATTLQYFGLALLIGLASGAYSSIFIASPIVAGLKEREPRYQHIRERLESRGTGAQLLSASAVAAGALTTADQGGSSKRKRGKAAPARSGTLRPGSGRQAASRAAEADLDGGGEIDEITAGDGDESGLATGAAAAAAPPAGAGKSRSGAGASSSSAQRRPPPRPRKKGKRR